MSARESRRSGESRADRFEQRTAQMVAAHPAALVQRVVGARGSATRLAMFAGFSFFASSDRYGHLVADATGLTLYQGRDDIEWTKSWPEVTTLAISPDGRSIEVAAIGWQAPKFYTPCRPNGDQLQPYAIGPVLDELRARRVLRPQKE